MPKRKASRAKKSKPAKKKKSAPRKAVRAKRPARRKKPARRRRVTRVRGSATNAGELSLPVRPGSGPGSGGQSGDIEGLPNAPGANSESVEELAEEGQSFEAELIDAVEAAPDPDEAEVETREVPENDVPEEYEDDRRNR
jgi:hypothetical protein